MEGRGALTARVIERERDVLGESVLLVAPEDASVSLAFVLAGLLFGAALDRGGWWWWWAGVKCMCECWIWSLGCARSCSQIGPPMSHLLILVKVRVTRSVEQRLQAPGKCTCHT